MHSGPSTALLCLLLTVVGQSLADVCPFNKDPCLCEYRCPLHDGKFQDVDCNLDQKPLPLFVGDQGRYAVMNQLTLENFKGELNDSTFAVFNTVQQLVIRDAEISNWRENCLQNVTVNSIHVEESEVMRISTSFGSPKDLVKLYVKGTPLYHDVMFKSSRGGDSPLALQELSLIHTQINAVPDKLVDMFELSYLDLSMNKISQVSAQAFLGNPKLTSVILDKNPIKQITNDMLASLKAVQMLSLQGTLIAEIDLSVFTSRTTLTTVSVGNSQHLTRIFVTSPYTETSPLSEIDISNCDQNIDVAPEIDDFLRKTDILLMLNHNHLTCNDNMNWMAYHVRCTKLLHLNGSICAGSGRFVEDYLYDKYDPSSCSATPTSSSKPSQQTTAGTDFSVQPTQHDGGKTKDPKSDDDDYFIKHPDGSKSSVTTATFHVIAFFTILSLFL